MDVFSIDTEISFDEWRKTIYHHAAAYVPQTKDPRRLLQTAKALYKEACRNAMLKKYDAAYYYTIKCLELCYKDKTGVELTNIYPECRSMFSDALDLQENLTRKGLRARYDQLIQSMHASESSREKMVAQQHEGDAADADSHFAHLERQRRLQESEQSQVNALRAQLTGMSLPETSIRGTQIRPQVTDDPPPPPYGEFSSLDTGTIRGDQSNVAPATPSPATQYSGVTLSPPAATTHQADSIYTTTYRSDFGRPMQSVTPSPIATVPYRSRYAQWAFNIAKFPITVPRRGIVNLGNTCYMNSVMQMINGTALADYFMLNEYQSYLVSFDGKYVRVTNAFIYVIRELRREHCGFAVSASAFRNAIGEAYEPFRNSSQQDANEFLRVLLDSLHSALNERAGVTIRFAEIDNTKGSDEELARRYWDQYAQRNSSVVSDHCAFQERSSVTCPSCGQNSRSFATSFGIEVPIPKKSPISIEDCLVAYTAQEQLGQDSLYSCPGCKEKVRAIKQLQFHSTPKTLFITLKRFRSYGDFSNMAKINDPVFFERALDLSPFMSSQYSLTRFQLVGIVNHQGNIHGGHYTADIMEADKVWTHFSDERMVEGSQPDFSQAYILCYTRVG